MDTFLVKLFDYYGISEKEYMRLAADVSVSDLPYAYAFFNYESFIARIEKALSNDETILIYGDYDADGILATSILKYAFSKRRKDVFTMIPNRYSDGYGLSAAVVKRLLKRDIDLIITVDNGVSAHAAITFAQEHGIDVLVSDHHELSETLPDALVLHPELSSLDKLNSCGAYMALVISFGLLGYYDDYLVTLAGIATVADMMPLQSRNRTVVKLALTNVNKYAYPSLVKLNGSPRFTDKDFGMKIAPRINALGRLSQNYETNILVEYFTTSDTLRINDIGAYVEKTYEERKKMSKARPLTTEEETLPAVVLETNELEGVLGLLAQNYVTTYHKPTILFTTSSEDVSLLKGSARSSTGLNIVDAFSALSDLIIVSGGHAEAGGLTIKKSDFMAFQSRFMTYAKARPLLAKEVKSISVLTSEINDENYQKVKALAPFGFGFSAPQFAVIDVENIPLRYSRDGKHLISALDNGVKIIGFNIDKNTINCEHFSFIGEFSESEFRGKLSTEFIIRDIKY